MSAPVAADAAAQAKRRRHNLFLQSGISEASVRNVKCRRVVRALRRWVRDGMPDPGPAGWRCGQIRHGGEAPYVEVRCSRRAARMRFTIGG